MTTNGIQIIQDIYAANGRADIPAVLALLTGDAEFSFEGASKDVPWHGPWRGHDGIKRFFGTLVEAVEFETFAPIAFVASDAAVVVRVHLRYKVRRTGKVVDQHQVHWWGLRDGKSTGVRHFEDTAQVIAAAG